MFRFKKEMTLGDIFQSLVSIFAIIIAVIALIIQFHDLSYTVKDYNLNLTKQTNKLSDKLTAIQEFMSTITAKTIDLKLGESYFFDDGLSNLLILNIDYENKKAKVQFHIRKKRIDEVLYYLTPRLIYVNEKRTKAYSFTVKDVSKLNKTVEFVISKKIN